MESLTISSCENDAKLTFSSLEGDECRAELTASHVSAQITVTSMYREEFRRLIEFFESMRKDWRGWDGVRDWSSAEGECLLSATSDRLGHTAIRVSFKPIYGQWLAEATLVLDVTQIDKLPRQLREFFTLEAA